MMEGHAQQDDELQVRAAALVAVAVVGWWMGGWLCPAERKE